MEYIYKPEYVDEVLMEKKRDIGIEDSVSETKNNFGSVLSQNTSEKDSETPLVRKDGPKFSKLRLILAIHLALLQQFVGINVVVGYGTDIASQIFPSYKNLIPVFLNFEQVVTSLTSSYLLVRIGRKSILQAGTIGGVVSLLFIAFGFWFKDSSEDLANVLIMVGLILFMANFGLSLGPIVWLYIPEILEPRYIPISTLANWAAAAVNMFLYPILGKAFGSSVPLFFFFAVWCTVSFFIAQKYLI